MSTHMLTRGVVLMVVLGLCVLTEWGSSAEAVITIKRAEVVNGAAVVEGGNAARRALIYWEGALVTQANNGGNFAFQGVVPTDCVGSLHEGDPAATIEVALANCGPVSDAPAPVEQTGQTQCWDPADTTLPIASIPCDGTGQDGEIRAGVPLPSPRFTDRGDGTVRDNLTGLIWLKDVTCLAPDPGKTWANALASVDDFNAGVDFSCVEYAAGTFADWRLPHVKELESLVHYGFYPTLSNAAGTGPWAEGDAFSGVIDGHYWSSTTDVETPFYAWVVRLHSGGTAFSGKPDNANLVLPVRGPE